MKRRKVMKNKQKNSTKWLILFIGLFAMFAWLANPALAQDDDPTLDTETAYSGDVPESEPGFDEDAEAADQGGFGPGGQDYWVGATQFYPRNGVFWTYQTFYYWSHFAGSLRQWEAQVELPAGARITAIRAFWYDSGASSMDVRLWRQYYNFSTNTPNVVGVSPVLTSSTSNYHTTAANMNYTTRVREGNDRNIYTLVLNMPSSSSYRFRGVRLFWEREVRTGLPNPFDDISSLNSRFQNAIKALAASGITGGCDFNSYCPNSPVTRGQMAVFLAEGLGLHWQAPYY
jgi:hypothetical protein